VTGRRAGVAWGGGLRGRAGADNGQGRAKSVPVVPGALSGGLPLLSGRWRSAHDVGSGGSWRCCRRPAPRATGARTHRDSAARRHRRDGARVPGLPTRHRSRCCGQDPASRALHERDPGRSIQSRGESGVPSRPPECRSDPARRAAPGRSDVHRHGILGRPVASKRAWRSGRRDTAISGAPRCAANVRSRGRSSRAGHRPPRSETRQRDAGAPGGRPGFRQGARLRHRAR
jgi:hypothetical protein